MLEHKKHRNVYDNHTTLATQLFASSSIDKHRLPQQRSSPAEMRHVTSSGAVLRDREPFPLMVTMRLRKVGCQLKSATASPSACCFSVLRCAIDFVPHASRSVSRVCLVSYRATWPSPSNRAPSKPGRVGHHASRVTFSRRSVTSVCTGSLNWRMSHTLTARSVPARGPQICQQSQHEPKVVFSSRRMRRKKRWEMFQQRPASLSNLSGRRI